MSPSWSEVTQSEGAPKPRSSHSVAVVDNKVYVFGGELEPRVPIDNLVHVFDLESRKWTTIEGRGQAPAPRVGVTLAAVDNILYVFAGRDKEHEELNELFSFDLNSHKWELLSSGACSPPARSYHAFTADEGSKKLYAFGGCGKEGRLNDLWVYDIKSGAWQAEASPPPSSGCVPRGGPGLVVADGAIWVIFGFDGRELSDIHRYNPESRVWEEIDVRGEKPAGRSVFGTAVFAKSILVYGGEVDPSDLGHLGAGSFSSEVLAFNTQTLQWKSLEVEVKQGRNPGARGWFAFSSFGNSMLVYGGNSDSNDRLDDMYILTVQAEKQVL